MLYFRFLSFAKHLFLKSQKNYPGLSLIRIEISFSLALIQWNVNMV